jgi:hypothetical protein
MEQSKIQRGKLRRAEHRKSPARLRFEGDEAHRLGSALQRQTDNRHLAQQPRPEPWLVGNRQSGRAVE